MNKKIFGKLSLILAIVTLILPEVFSFNSLTLDMIYFVVFLLLSIVSIVFGFMGKKDSKGLSIAGIIIGFISLAILCLALVGLFLFKNATNCVDNGNETSVCDCAGQKTEVPNYYLTEEQMIKE